MKQIVLSSCFALMAITGFAQAKTTTSATVAFDATTPLDALPKAENKTVVAMLNTKSGEVGFEAAVNNFAFTNPTIQQHFNEERWLNSGKFPLFTFAGKITDLKNVNFKKDGKILEMQANVLRINCGQNSEEHAMSFSKPKRLTLKVKTRRMLQILPRKMS